MFKNVSNSLVRQWIFARKISNQARAMKAQLLLDEIYSAMLTQRFRDIIVIQTKFNTDPRYLVLGTANSSRHLMNGTELLNKQYKNSIKEDDQEFGRLGISSEWNVLDFHSVVVHVFSKDCREKYDIEQLWSVGEKYDDQLNFPDQVTGLEEKKTSSNEWV